MMLLYLSMMAFLNETDDKTFGISVIERFRSSWPSSLTWREREVTTGGGFDNGECGKGRRKTDEPVGQEKFLKVDRATYSTFKLFAVFALQGISFNFQAFLFYKRRINVE